MFELPRFLRANTWPPILKIAALLFLATDSQSLVGQTQPDPIRYESQILTFEERDFSSPPPSNAILLVGSSSIRFWNNASAELSPLTIIQRGFGGSVMNDVVYYFDRIVSKYNPRAIVLYEGDNDLAYGLSPSTILSQFDTLTTMIKTELPNTRIYILSVKPSIARAHLWHLAVEVNAGFSERAAGDEKISHIPIAKYLNRTDGSFRNDIFVSDQLHLNNLGYEIWSEVIRAALSVHEAPEEAVSLGTIYYPKTQDLISDCVNVTTDTEDSTLAMSLRFRLINSNLVIQDFKIRDQPNKNCEDQLRVLFNQDGSVASARYDTRMVSIHQNGTQYQLSANYSDARKPLSENNSAFLFDRINFSAIK
jgi:hypothetical protein